MANTRNQGLRFPGGTDAPNGPLAFQQLAEDVERISVQRFTSVADRTTRQPNPVPGMVCWMPDGPYAFFSGAWQPYPGRPVVSVQLGEPNYGVFNVWTDFTASQWPSESVVVPPSGTVSIELGGEIGNINTPTASCRIGVRLSGALTQAPDGRSSLRVDGTRLSASRAYKVFNLSPGAVLTATPAWFITSGTAAEINIGNGRLYLTPEG